MTDVPRRLPPGQAERTRVALTRATAGSMRGGTRMAKPVTLPTPRVAGGNVTVVIHGADGTVGRPSAAIVMWVGAAKPSNAVDFDMWYAATI